MYGYIYETTNLINNKKYIGKHKSKIFDINYYGSGIGIKNALKKYGKHISESTKKKLQKVRKGRKWINNNIIEKWVKQEEIQKYLEKGFVKGRLKK